MCVLWSCRTEYIIDQEGGDVNEQQIYNSVTSLKKAASKFGMSNLCYAVKRCSVFVEWQDHGLVNDCVGCKACINFDVDTFVSATFALSRREVIVCLPRYLMQGRVLGWRNFRTSTSRIDVVLPQMVQLCMCRNSYIRKRKAAKKRDKKPPSSESGFQRLSRRFAKFVTHHKAVALIVTPTRWPMSAYCLLCSVRL